MYFGNNYSTLALSRSPPVQPQNSFLFGLLSRVTIILFFLCLSPKIMPTIKPSRRTPSPNIR